MKVELSLNLKLGERYMYLMILVLEEDEKA
jgi:hypothetical protein